MRDFLQYLDECLVKGQIDFSIRAHNYGHETRFYIHPTGKDGETMDFRVFGNELRTLSDTKNGQGRCEKHEPYDGKYYQCELNKEHYSNCQYSTESTDSEEKDTK